MTQISDDFKKLSTDLEKARNFFLEYVQDLGYIIHVYTHRDADGLSAGAILGKALYREKLPFQISILRQLEREEISNLAQNCKDSKLFLIFSDFGSGQYKDLQKTLDFNGNSPPFLILDHHLPQGISNKEDLDNLRKLYENSRPWHINPYFYNANGSNEISGSGLCYLFAKTLNLDNVDLAPIAMVGAIGDIQNQGPNKTFQGLNSTILKDANENKLIEVVDDLNFSSIKPLNEAIAYSSDIELPGLTNDPNKTLIFLQKLGVLMEDAEGNIRTLSDLKTEEKRKVSSAIIEYATLKLDIEPSKIYHKLIVNRYLLKGELEGSELYDLNEFSNLLNSCGRTDNGSLGIAIAMGDRKRSFQIAKEILVDYKKSLMKSLNWVFDEEKIQEKEYLQYFFGEDVIPESIIGTIATMLSFDNSGRINHNKPIFGLAKREDEGVYKVSGRANELIVKQGVNLSEVMREACELAGLDVLGGGHPPAAGTKVPIDKIDLFLEKSEEVVRNQLKK